MWRSHIHCAMILDGRLQGNVRFQARRLLLKRAPAMMAVVSIWPYVTTCRCVTSLAPLCADPCHHAGERTSRVADDSLPSIPKTLSAQQSSGINHNVECRTMPHGCCKHCHYRVRCHFVRHSQTDVFRCKCGPSIQASNEWPRMSESKLTPINC